MLRFALYDLIGIQCMRQLITALLLAFFVTACGYKGPLYLPPPDNTQQSGNK